MKYFGKYLDENGYERDPIYARQCGFVKGQMYEVEDADVGRCNSTVKFLGIEEYHNSVLFEFYNEHMVHAEKQFYSEPLFNVYHH